MDELLKELSEYASAECNVPMSAMTTLRIGGTAAYVVYPENSLALDAIIRIIRKHNVPFKVFGKGSNMLCSDSRFEGVVIRLDRYMDSCYFEGTRVTAEAGTSIIALSYEALKNGLSGLEFASGIPGTVGGAVYMNAGAYRNSMSEIVDSVFVYRDGALEWISADECEFGYRSSIFQKHPDWIIVGVRMNLKEGDPAEIRSLMDSRRERRISTQPLDKPSAGSVFRNPDEVPAWKLIEGIGYRGRTCGGAKVSEKHVNFIVNEQHATAEDFLKLVESIQREVKKTYGIDLHMEVEKFNWD
ncbi:MAG: UDP-N-acetylmuramate dehydrogenase [Solobacterium sp.]|nr:UDP-N-acetylmuramate dehydrogenase [Erysipelotrichaceae bacterium]MBQ9152901.1 UDP-N-acetylmuramate dehydrogenase [Solobacterium sp.]